MKTRADGAPIKWCEISRHANNQEKNRFKLLDEELKKAGVLSELTFVQATPETLEDVLAKARNEFGQMRFTGRMGSLVLTYLDRVPASVAALKGSDALVCEQGEWWPRFFLVEGLNETLANDATNLDFSGSVLILGATSEARATVAAVSRIGYSKIIVTDVNEEHGQAFVEELRRSYFGIQFQFVARHQVTQLPGICSIAVNTLTMEEDQAAAKELAYFNFLKPGGAWVDLAVFPLNVALKQEAESVGASIVSGAKVLATTDRLWAKAAFNVTIDTDGYAHRLAQL